MITALSVNREGQPVINSERKFTEKQWATMQYMFGDKLRWIRVKDEPKLKKKPRKADVKEAAAVTKQTEDLTEENTNIE